MDIACDIGKPLGYWVQQTRQTGETVAVKILYDQPAATTGAVTSEDRAASIAHPSNYRDELAGR